MWVSTARSDKNSHDARREPTFIAAARSQMAASFPRGTFSQAELTAECVIRPLNAPDQLVGYPPGTVIDRQPPSLAAR